MIRKKLLTLVAATAMVATIQTAQADIIHLSDLAGANGVGTANTLSVGDKIFSGFTFTESGLNNWDPSQIVVTASIGPNGIYLLTFSGNMQLSTIASAQVSADLKLNYSVTATGGAISMIDQAYAGSATSGTLAIDENVYSSGAPTAHSHLGVTDLSDPNAFFSGAFNDVGESDLLTVNPPQNTIYVTKDIAFYAVGGTLDIPAQVSISEVEQSFHQVPEPTTMIAGALLLLPFGASTLRILRKKQTA